MYNTCKISDLPDKELLLAYKETGKTAYMGELFNRHLPFIYGVCLKYLNDDDKTKTTVIQIFDDLLFKIVDYKIDSFRTWIYGVSKNYCLQISQNEEPFIKVDIDSDDAEFDNIACPVNNNVKRIKRYVTKRTFSKSHQRKRLQLLTTIFIIAGFICISAIFFLYARDTSDQGRDHTPLFASAYPVAVAVPTAPAIPVTPVAPTAPVVVDDQSAETPDSSQIEETKDAAPQDNPVDSEEIGVTNKQKEQPAHVKKVQSKASSDEISVPNDRYTLSNEETQAILSQDHQTHIEEYTQPVQIQETPQSVTKQAQQSVTGYAAFNRYVEKNRKSLKDNNHKELHGKVILMFKVNDRGRPVDIAVLRPFCREADREAVRLLQNGPDWIADNKTIARVEVDF